MHAFLADPTDAAYEQVVDRLLASPRYGERWARHWMDVWRYSDWYGRRAVPDVINSYAQIWRWRDWIVRSLNEDKGYDRMVQEMLAADEIAPTDDDNLVATGFLVRNFYRWNYNSWMKDNVEHTGKAFLGLTFNCAHCHDHKYDPITHEDYFAFRAFFEPLECGTTASPASPTPAPTRSTITARRTRRSPRAWSGCSTRSSTPRRSSTPAASRETSSRAGRRSPPACRRSWAAGRSGSSRFRCPPRLRIPA